MESDQLQERIAAALWGDYHSGKIGLYSAMPIGEAELLFANEDRETRLIYRAKAKAVIDVLPEVYKSNAG